MQESININGKIITEGERYQHKLTGVIYEIKKSSLGKLQFDNNIIHVDVTADRLNKVRKL